MIKNDIKRHDGSEETYPLSSDMSSVEIAISFLPESLILLLDTLIVGVDKKLKKASIGQAIMQATSFDSTTTARTSSTDASPFWIKIPY